MSKWKTGTPQGAKTVKSLFTLLLKVEEQQLKKKIARAERQIRAELAKIERKHAK